MMGGNIFVESVYGKGSTFTAEIPQKVVDASPIGDFASRLKETMNSTEEYKPILVAPNARVLIVDDNDMNLDVITGLLSDTRIKLTTADSGRECLARLKEGEFDVILLDQMMPGMSGRETLAEIRSGHLADHTPIIALTADAIVGARESYLKEGFSDYLSKPVMYEDLERILLKYIDKKLLLTQEMLEREEEKKDKPVVLVINDSSERLNEIKEMLGTAFKGVFVKDEAQAEKYLAGHKVEFVIRDGGDR